MQYFCCHWNSLSGPQLSQSIFAAMVHTSCCSLILQAHRDYLYFYKLADTSRRHQGSHLLMWMVSIIGVHEDIWMSSDIFYERQAEPIPSSTLLCNHFLVFMQRCCSVPLLGTSFCLNFKAPATGIMYVFLNMEMQQDMTLFKVLSHQTCRHCQSWSFWWHPQHSQQVFLGDQQPGPVACHPPGLEAWPSYSRGQTPIFRQKDRGKPEQELLVSIFSCRYTKPYRNSIFNIDFKFYSKHTNKNRTHRTIESIKFDSATYGIFNQRNQANI